MREHHAPASPSAGTLARAAWALFDWAAQPYHTLITAFIFAPYFATDLVGDPVRGQAVWGYVQSATGVAIALAAPVIGALADRSGRLKEFVFLLSIAYVAAAGLIWGAVPGAIWLAAVAVGVAGFAVEMAAVLTNAMLPRLAAPGRMGALSGSAWALGFIGGLVSLALTIAFLSPVPGSATTIAGLAPAFGLEAADGGPARATGPLAAIWYVIFAAPLFLWVPASVAADPGGPSRKLGDTFRTLRRQSGLLMFFAARLAYQDGLLAVFAFGGIYAAGFLGWGTTELGLFGILLTVTGAIGAFAGGRLDDRLGAKPVIAVTILMCLAALAIIAMLERPGPTAAMFSRPADQAFLVAGTLIGIAAGPLQAASRTYLARLAPADEIAAYFGLYAFSGKAVSFTGPLLVALATDIGGSQRAGILPIAVLFVVGFALLVLAPRDRR